MAEAASIARPDAAAGKRIGADLWTQFLATLKDTRLTTFALVAQHVSLEQRGGGIVLVFEPEVRQAYHFAQKAEHLTALGETAGKVLPASAGVQLMVAGEPATLVPKLEIQAPAVTEDLPEEIRHDIFDADDSSQPGTVDPSKLEAAARDVESGLKSRQQAASTPSAQEAISLFDATELDPEED